MSADQARAGKPNTINPGPNCPERVVGRLAPSPTGAQHVGNARTYLIAWLSARSRGGQVHLRIEDLDSPRVKEGAAQQVLEDLCWLGLNWDGEVLVQTQRLSLYEAALGRLQTEDLVYPCTCTRADVDRAASAPHVDHEGPSYPGTCSERRVGDVSHLAGRSFAWRFRAGGRVPEFVDGFQRLPRKDLAEGGGDFVIWNSAGTPAYQLAVVVDDAAQRVTEVVRGDDLVPSTPRQLLLYKALDLRPPGFIHVPLVVGPDGRRLAKRHGDTRLSALRGCGLKPEALLGLLAWSCGWIVRREPITVEELLPLFRVDAIPPAPFVLEASLIKELNG